MAATEHRRLLGVAFFALTLAACGTVREPRDSAPAGPISVEHLPEPVPRTEPRSRYGNPASYSVAGQRYRVWDSADGYLERGTASWYGTKFHGRRTSSGEPYDMYTFTAAHKHLPLPSYVRVTNLDNGRSLVVRVNDRGPFHSDRIIDLSYAAAIRLGYAQQGTARVEVEALTPGRMAEANDRPATRPTTSAEATFLQLGAFDQRDNAERLRGEVERQTGQSLRIVEADQDGRALYRVQLGPLADEPLVRQLETRLQALGYRPHRVW